MKRKLSLKNTLKLVADIEFDQLNTAAYSPRPGTPRRDLGESSHSEMVKSDRLQRLEPSRFTEGRRCDRSATSIALRTVLVEDQKS